MITDSFYKRLVLVLLIPLFSYAIKYAYNVLLAHLLKGGLYGDFTIGLKTLIFFSSLMLLGTATTSKRFLSAYLQKHNEATQLDYVRWNLRLIAKSFIFFMSCLIVLVIVMMLLHVFSYKEFTGYHIAVYMVFLSPLYAVASLLIIYTECGDNVYWYNLLSRNGIPIVYILVFLVEYFVFSSHFSNVTLWLISLITLFILNIISLILAFFYLPNIVFKNIVGLNKIFSYDIVVSSEWNKASKHFIISENLFIIVNIISLYIIKLCASDTFAVNEYAVIVAIGIFVWTISGCIAARLEPVIYSCFKENNKKNLQKYLNQCSWMNFLVSSCATVLLIYFGKDILRTFGADYSTPALSEALIILLLGYYIGTFGQLANRLLALSGNEVWLIYITIVELTLIVVLGVMLTIKYNVTGMVIAETITIIFKVLFYIIVSYLKTGVKTVGFI